MSRALYLSPPSFDGFDGGAGARYQARPEVTSYWYPTWLEDKDILVRRCREGYEFFKSLNQRKHDLAAAKAAA
jgi:hypothetical protein